MVHLLKIIGEDVMVAYPSGEINDLDKKHIDAIVKANERGKVNYTMNL